MLAFVLVRTLRAASLSCTSCTATAWSYQEGGSLALALAAQHNNGNQILKVLLLPCGV